MTNVLFAVGLRVGGKPLSEAVILGISGGLGAGYILWEFKEHHTKVLVLGFHNRWQYPIDYFQLTCDRLGVQVAMPETGSRKIALETLKTALNQGVPAIAWVDRASLPYLQLPEAMQGHIGHNVVVCGMEGDNFLVDDLARQPFKVSEEALTAARARISSYKNRLLLVEQVPEQPDLPAAIRQGLEDCVQHLSSASESFSLPTLRKWGRTMTDGKNKKGWLKVFEDRRGLYSTLRSIFEGIELNGASGGLRGMYADFLVEAAEVLNQPELAAAAEPYRALSHSWTMLAEEALPDEVFKETKALLRERQRLLMEGGDAWRNTQGITEQLRLTGTQYNLDFPMDEGQILDLFTRLQDRLLSIYEAETAALSTLKQAVSR
jgi:hypothetical protein